MCQDSSWHLQTAVVGGIQAVCVQFKMYAITVVNPNFNLYTEIT